MIDANSAKTGARSKTGRVHDALDLLEGEHKMVKSLFSDLSSAPPSRRAGIVEQLKALLIVHNATEENLVYPAIRIAAGQKREASALYHQQDEAQAGLWELGEMLKGRLDDGDFAEKAQELAKAVVAHAEHEEETEFPQLREALGKDGMAELTGEVQAFRSSFRYESQ